MRWNYSTHYYCRACQMAVLHGDAVGNKPKCPECGEYVRTRRKHAKQNSRHHPTYNMRIDVK